MRIIAVNDKFYDVLKKLLLQRNSTRLNQQNARYQQWQFYSAQISGLRS